MGILRDGLDRIIECSIWGKTGCDYKSGLLFLKKRTSEQPDEDSVDKTQRHELSAAALL